MAKGNQRLITTFKFSLNSDYATYMWRTKWVDTLFSSRFWLTAANAQYPFLNKRKHVFSLWICQIEHVVGHHKIKDRCHWIRTFHHYILFNWYEVLPCCIFIINYIFKQDDVRLIVVQVSGFTGWCPFLFKHKHWT